jgi:hypothetical protein
MAGQNPSRMSANPLSRCMSRAFLVRPEWWSSSGGSSGVSDADLTGRDRPVAGPSDPNSVIVPDNSLLANRRADAAEFGSEESDDLLV